MRIELTEDERNAICNAADLAIEDQKNYISTGSGAVDYGEEWPAVARAKSEAFLQLAGVLQKIGFVQIAADAAELAREFMEVE